MSDEPEGTNSGGIGGALSIVEQTLGDLVTGIPAPIRKNAFKAFNRLCTAAIEYPVALIENSIAEKRAESQARVKLINVSAGQIAEQMHTNPEYARAAATKFAHKIVREQVRIDQISQIAAAELQSESLAPANNEEQEAAPISEDWLNAFEKEATQMSSAQMQRLFGKILAGEIRKPTSYSIKTVKIVAQLDNTAAALFRLLCSLSISLRIPKSNVIVDSRVVSMGIPSNNSLASYGLSFDALNALQEYGLIISEYNSWRDYQASVVHEGAIIAPMIHQKAQWALVPKVAPPARKEFRVTGVALSRCGSELLSIVDIEPNEVYTTALKSFFDMEGMIMENLDMR